MYATAPILFELSGTLSKFVNNKALKSCLHLIHPTVARRYELITGDYLFGRARERCYSDY